MNVSNNSSLVFGWLVNITTVSGLIGWVVIEFTYLRFWRALRVQGYERRDLPYQSPGQPYVAWITMVLVSVILLTSGMCIGRFDQRACTDNTRFLGFDVFVKGNFTVSGFLTCYLNLGIFVGTSYRLLTSSSCSIG
jgi:amino acid transporter